MKSKKGYEITWYVAVMALVLLFIFVYSSAWANIFRKSASSLNEQIGSASDYDKDGVINIDDKCPCIVGDLNNQGCPAEYKITETGTGNEGLPRQGNSMELNAGQFEKILCEGSLDIRGDGRAGSGILLAMQSLAMVAIGDPTLYVQEWPFFSAARKGAPTRGFLRLSRRPIEKSSNILSPHISILMDEGVAKMVDFAEGSLRGGIYILNTGHSPEEVAKKYRLTGRVYTIDGDKLGEKYLKKPIGNISIFPPNILAISNMVKDSGLPNP